MRRVYAILDLIIYGNFWIAACALALTFQTQLLLNGKFQLTPVAAFIFFGTLALYGIHRIVGLKKVSAFQDKGRFAVVGRFKSHILFYSILSGAAAAWYGFQIPWRVLPWIVLPAFLGAGYVLPVFKGKRLRDFNYIKIFLVAASWSLLTVLGPAAELKLNLNAVSWVMCLERMAFIFAIGLAFDLRDLEIDRLNGVKTLPAIWGAKRTQWVAAGCLGLVLLLAGLNNKIEAYSDPVWLGIATTAALTLFLVQASTPEKHDYFYSGLVDGVMILQFLAVWMGICLF